MTKLKLQIDVLCVMKMKQFKFLLKEASKLMQKNQKIFTMLRKVTFYYRHIPI